MPSPGRGPTSIATAISDTGHTFLESDNTIGGTFARLDVPDLTHRVSERHGFSCRGNK
jgi:hypothetical protein